MEIRKNTDKTVWLEALPWYIGGSIRQNMLKLKSNVYKMAMKRGILWSIGTVLHIGIVGLLLYILPGRLPFNRYWELVWQEQFTDLIHCYAFTKELACWRVITMLGCQPCY